MNIFFKTNRRLQKKAAILVASIIFSNTLNADTGRYRAMFGNDPSTTMTIGFDAYEAETKPVLYYSTSPINTNSLESYTSETPDTVVIYHDMVNCFVRLTNLSPGKTYYFTVKDSLTISEVYNFETISNHDSTKLSILAGGGSRSNLDVRRVANKVVSKLNAHAIMFDGDFTDTGSSLDWKQWFDDLRLTINSNNRITPIIPARGSHESNNTMLVNLFDCEENIIYKKTLGNNLLEIYTLNSEIYLTYAATQTAWLENQLINSNSIWKFAQYHRPIRPHITQKLEGAIQYGNWANLFYKYEVDAVLEGDSYTTKTTWPIIPCSGGFDCDEGFKRDDNNGTVYLGEGSYSALLRNVNDIKSWTRDSGTFYQFNWIFIDKNKMEIRKVKYDSETNPDLIDELDDSIRFTIPQNLEIWNPENGDLVTLSKSTTNIPTCIIIAPNDNEMYFDLSEIPLQVNVSNASTFTQVQFYVNGTLIGIDFKPPYQLNWQPDSIGVYTISATAQDINGLSSELDFSTIKIEEDRDNIIHTSSIDISSDEFMEYENKWVTVNENIKGYVSINELKIRICKSGVSLQGLRFKEINIPPKAIVDSAYIKLNPSSGRGLANATIWCEDSANSSPFVPVPFNLTQRQKTSNFVDWHNIASWDDSNATVTSPDLTTLIQDLIQRPDWTIESPITFLITGSGERNANSSMAKQLLSEDSYLSPTLIVRFSIPDIKGCTDTNACNYNPDAKIDNFTCEFPDINNLTLNTVGAFPSITWDAISNATYILHYRKSGESNFRTYSTPIPYIVFIGLDDCTTYDFVIEITCQSGNISKFSEPINYTTTECKESGENIYISDKPVIHVYPQPATNYLTIDLAGSKEVNLINVHNTLGQLVIDGDNISFDGSVYRTNVDHLLPGIYFLSTITDNYAETKKILVK